MNLLKRVAVALITIPIFIFFLFKGGYYLLALMTVFSLISVIEMYNMMAKKKIFLNPFVFVTAPAIFLLIANNYFSFVYGIIIFQLMISLSVALFQNTLDGAIRRAGSNTITLLYPSSLFAFIYLIRNDLESGKLLIFALVIIVWTTDSFAYFVGMKFGKHRNLFPASPKKSVEGFVGGFVFAFIAAFILHYFLDISLLQLLLAAFICGVFGQLGDLLESVLKRDIGVKDSSNLIPGHGGILDRFDSLVVVSPIFYFAYKILEDVFNYVG